MAAFAIDVCRHCVLSFHSYKLTVEEGKVAYLTFKDKTQHNQKVYYYYLMQFIRIGQGILFIVRSLQ